jgi:gliding motility-associated-like protein
MSPFKKLDLLLMFVLCIALGHTLTAQVTLTHNVGEIVPGTISSCSPTFTGRTFTLQDFGVAENEELTINAAEIAYQIKIERELRAWVTFYVYEIDDNFPDSFSRTPSTLLGKSQLVELETSPTNNGLTPLKTLTANFNIPVTVPPNTKRILVEVEGRLRPNSLHLASTEGETDSTWLNGDCPPYTYDTADNYGYPNAHFYLKVFGSAKVPSGCSDYPLSYGQSACDLDGDGIGQFDTTYWGNALRWAGEISFFDAQGAPLPDPLPNLYTNTTPYREVISVRATDPLTGDCLEMTRVLTTYDPPINIKQPPTLYACDEGNGFAHFDVSTIEEQIIGTQTGLNPSYINISYMDADGQQLSGFPSTSYRNEDPHSQTVYVQVTYDEPYKPNCLEETSFDLIVRPRPQAGPLNDLVVQDNDGDGFAEFDTSGIESAVLGSQTGMQVSYFDALGFPLPSPLPNPFTNTTPYHEVITVRVTDPLADNCYTETPLSLRVSNTPIVNRPPDMNACDEGNGFAHFDVSLIETQVIGTQTGLNVSYLDTHGQVLQDFLSASYRNLNPYSQTVTVSVTDQSDPTFHVETAFDLIVNPTPVVHPLDDLMAQDDDGDGFEEFDTSGIESAVVGNQTGMQVSYFDTQGSALPSPLPNPYTNTVPYLETITVVVTNPLTGCSLETPLTFDISLILPDTTIPIIERPTDQYACDEGNGFAHFDVSEIEAQIIGSQTGLNVSYLDADGQELSGFPSTSYRNLNPFSQTVTVRVANSNDPGNYAEISFNLIVTSLHEVHPLDDLVACDDDSDGFAEFDTSTVEAQILGGQTGLRVSYHDQSGQELSGFPSASYRNKDPYSQTVTVRVVGEDSPNCYSEASFDLIVIRPPVIDLRETYYLCDLEPSRTITANPDADSWRWVADDGAILSSSSEVNLSKEGTYTLFMGKARNGVSCESSASFRLVRTEPATIQQLNTGEGFSGDNHIEVLASGEGDLEYSIDGEHYQDDNMFRGLSEGVYTVYLRDRDGCGEDSRETVLLDYPKFFSPNSDGMNDRWQIGALEDFPDAMVQIFDRYGKLLGQIRPDDSGWDGTFKGNPLPSSDYWFILNLGDGREYKKHFALKR